MADWSSNRARIAVGLVVVAVLVCIAVGVQLYLKYGGGTSLPAPRKGIVIDMTTEEPIEGAKVIGFRLARSDRERHISVFEGRPWALVDLLCETDSAGRFEFKPPSYWEGRDFCFAVCADGYLNTCLYTAANGEARFHLTWWHGQKQPFQPNPAEFPDKLTIRLMPDPRAIPEFGE